MRIPIGYLKLSPSYPIFDFRRRDDRPRAKKRRRIEKRGVRRTARGRWQPSANPGEAASKRPRPEVVLGASQEPAERPRHKAMSGGSANPGAGRDQTERSRRKLLASYLFFLVIISELPFLSVHNLSGNTPCYNRGMDVIVCHISALHYWLSHIGAPVLTPSDLPSLPNLASLFENPR